MALAKDMTHPSTAGHWRHIRLRTLPISTAKRFPLHTAMRIVEFFHFIFEVFVTRAWKPSTHAAKAATE